MGKYVEKNKICCAIDAIVPGGDPGADKKGDRYGELVLTV